MYLWLPVRGMVYLNCSPGQLRLAVVKATLLGTRQMESGGAKVHCRAPEINAIRRFSPCFPGLCPGSALCADPKASH